MTTETPTAPRDHLVPDVTDRGFAWLPALSDTYGSNAVRVLASSAADEPCIWLRVGDAENNGEQSVAHLSAGQAWQLKEQIEWLLEHHHQGDSRPADLEGAVR